MNAIILGAAESTQAASAPVIDSGIAVFDSGIAMSRRTVAPRYRSWLDECGHATDHRGGAVALAQPVGFPAPAVAAARADKRFPVQNLVFRR
ncbi:hypothetical protein QNM97_05900 [Gordonia sp. L191]|uniref:hypothetical protein n=1 Tax=Gordonia TaxID=2053 RepID=UPI001AD779F7|nr:MULTISPECIES: hypothetical protein [Gordonia]QTI68009.1 hypothetical protein J6U32_21165 [Gordonia polyisoprenivorans]WHU48532.1 hypothetical protein QNM97_05900 [Gordonia sp. L191]